MCVWCVYVVCMRVCGVCECVYVVCMRVCVVCVSVCGVCVCVAYMDIILQVFYSTKSELEPSTFRAS